MKNKDLDIHGTPVPPVPDGHVIKGVSTYVSKAGEIGQWIKTSKVAESKEDAIRRLIQEIPNLVISRANRTRNFKFTGLSNDLLSVYPIGDAHLGMLAWGEETGDRDFDLNIGKGALLGSTEYLVNQGEPTEDALVFSTGDFAHSDNNSGMTSRSGNILDTDTRWAKTLRVCVMVALNTIEAALMHHNRVRVIFEMGNHDDHTSYFLSLIVDAYYHNEPRVSVDLSPRNRHYCRFGKCLIGITHGDRLKEKELESIMANDFPEEWGATRYRYWYTGHIHHIRKIETRGCIVESFRTLAPLDAWHAGQGYKAGSDMSKIVLHKEYGEVHRITCDYRIIS